MRHFKMLRTMVGPFEINRIVPESDLLNANADIGHLLGNDSIVEVDMEDEPLTEEPVAIGPHNPGGKFHPEVPLEESSAEQVDETGEVVESVEEIQTVETEEQPQKVSEIDQPQEVTDGTVEVAEVPKPKPVRKPKVK